MASGHMREYETIAILRPDLLDEGVERIKGRVAQVVERMEGRLLRFDNWGKRKLAYEVKKYPKGIFLYFLYLGNPGIVEEIERNFRMWDDVIRYMTVKLDDEADPEARPSEISDEELQKAALAAAGNKSLVAEDDEESEEAGEPEAQGEDLGTEEED